MRDPGLPGELVLLLSGSVEGSSGGWGECSVRCWVLREHVSVSLGERRTGFLGLRTAGHGLVGVGGGGGVSGCSLRTAQWMRASL